MNSIPQNLYHGAYNQIIGLNLKKFENIAKSQWTKHTAYEGAVHKILIICN